MLQSGRDIHRIAGHEELAIRASAGDRLAAVHADPSGKRHPQLAVQIAHRVAHRESRTHGTLGIVVMQQRDTEHDHDGIADELFDGTAVRFRDRRHSLEVRSHHGAHRLGVVVRPEGRRPNDIGEDDAHELPLFGGHHQPPRCTTSEEGLRPTTVRDGDGRSVGALCPIAIVPTAVYSSGTPKAARKPA